MEREYSVIQSAANDISSSLKAGSAKEADVTTAIDGMISKVATLKRKVRPKFAITPFSRLEVHLFDVH